MWGKEGRYGECGEREGDMECEEGRKIWRVWGKGRRYGELGGGGGGGGEKDRGMRGWGGGRQ